MSGLQGFCDERFHRLRQQFATNLERGEELGATVFVDLGGRPVVDLWGGFQDRDRTVPWSRDTIVNLWSTTKTVTCLAALMLIDRGEVDAFAPVARYWPEFAANGKAGIQIRHLLAHTSGVSGWERPFGTEDMYDWEKSTALLAQQAPWWAPGTAAGYHARNQGHLIGEVVHRVTGQMLKDFVATEIAAPLRADFQIGAREEDWGRIAEIIPPPPMPAFDLSSRSADDPMVKTFFGPPPSARAANTPGWRRADIGAANGHGNARSVARIMSAITLRGTVDGASLLSPGIFDLVFRQQANGRDLVLDLPLRRGIGYAFPSAATAAYLPEGRICFWGGWGGSQIIMDLDRQLTIAYVMNKMGTGILSSPRSEAYVNAIYGALVH